MNFDSKKCEDTFKGYTIFDREKCENTYKTYTMQELYNELELLTADLLHYRHMYGWCKDAVEELKVYIKYKENYK